MAAFKCADIASAASKSTPPIGSHCCENERKSCSSYAAVYELPTVASRLPAAANMAVAVPRTEATFRIVTVARGGRVQAP